MITYPIPSFTQPDRAERLLAACPEIDSIFQRFAEERHIPGLAYGVLLDGELIFEQSLGVTNIATQRPATTESIFRIASMTKSFAALAIMQLRDAGHLRLDDPAATYVPELASLVYPSTDDAPITIRQLLSMNVGWPQDDPWADRQLYQNDAALSDFYHAGVTWSNPPGVLFEYSNYAYMVLGRIITNVTKMPAIDYISQQILAPLGMNQTVWNARDVPTDQLVQGYRWEDDQWKTEELLPSGGDVAAFAGLFTSVRDLAHWVSLFLSAWPAGVDHDDRGPTHAILSRSSLREMQRIRTAQAPNMRQTGLAAIPKFSAAGYGFGLSCQHNGQALNVGHGGGLPGFGSHMRWAPEYGIGIIAFSNVTYGSMTLACMEAIDLLLEESQLQPLIQPIAPHLADASERLISLFKSAEQNNWVDWDDDAAETLFADNFLLDKDKAHWLSQWAELAETHGTLTPDGPIDPQNWLRGTWRMAGERGWCDIKITLSPTVPPKIQTLNMTSTLLPAADLYATMDALVDLITRPTKRAFKKLCASNAANDELWDQIRIAHVLCGDCSVGQILGGDGKTEVEFEMDGAKSDIMVDLHVDQRGKVEKLVLSVL